MKNLLNIDDQVKVIMPGYVGDGETVKITQIDSFNGELFYTGIYHQNCPDGGEGFDNSIQFKEGQYELVTGSCSNEKGNAVGGLSIAVHLDGIEEAKKDLNNLATQLDVIFDKMERISSYKY